MKSLKKPLALLLLVALVLSLSGCGLAQGRLAIAAMKMQKLNSLRMDLDLELGMTMSMLGENTNIDMDLSGIVGLVIEPLKIEADLSTELFGEPFHLLCYANQDGSKLVTFTSVDGGRLWSRSENEISAPEGGSFLNAETIAGIAKLAGSFVEQGTDTVRGSEVTIYAGKVTGEDLNTVFAAAGLEQTLEKALEADIPDGSLDFSGIDPVPITLCLDRSANMFTRFTIDLSPMMQILTPVVLHTAVSSALSRSAFGDLGSLDLSILGFSFDLNKVILSCEMYDFDAVGDITVPAEALSAGEAAA